jgi:glucose/arabinose dehydrogenase
VLISVEDPYDNHNGGTTVFGPDSLLYQSLGDGGAGGDPLRSGQNLGSLLGKVLRIDVDHTDAGLPYAIPKDNPFVGKAGARGEIWAYGLRNVWRMSFDSDTGDLWGGDVGQNAYEEIDLITKGGNFGWNVREGTHPFKDGGDLKAIEPVIDYPRSMGISVTGGYVYRGKANPTLVGWYVYGDFQSGRIWALKRQENGETRNIELQGQGKMNISSFAQNRAGELFITAFDKKIYRLVP